MDEHRPNATALRVALKRAAHQILDDPKVLDDPVALRIITKEALSALSEDPKRVESGPLASYVRAFVAARSRLAEDELAAGMLRGVRQYVILGAGLDTFAYRNRYPHDVLRVFEVDRPGTQSWKRRRLEEAGIPLPGNLTFVPVDFERMSLAQGLLSAGCDPRSCTFFSWLGVTEYLTAQAVYETLRFVASMPQGSGIVFDYMISPSLLTPAQRSRFEVLAQRVASAGEPWKTCFDPASLARDLSGMGFSSTTDKGPDEINRAYFAHRQDGLRIGSLSHIMVAWV